MRALLLLALLLAACAAAAAQATGGANSTSTPFVPRDDILLDCGAKGQGNDTDGRVWTGDAGSKYAPPDNLASVASASGQDPSVPQVPYLTARVSASPFTYSFPLGPGRKFLRLHFYPANYSNRDAADGLFSVSVAIPGGKLTLLSNFSAYQTAAAITYSYLIRKFSVNVSSPTLDLTFTPEKGHPNAYAFVNGIEVVSSPDLFDISTPNMVAGDGNLQQFPIDAGTAMQTMYRLNVGGQAISPSKDTGGYRSWDDDSTYIFGASFGVSYPKDNNVTITYPSNVPEYVAPEDVYGTARSMGPTKEVNMNFNLTWMLQVDAGFMYLIRLHFCEIQYPITKINQRVFNIYINNQTAVKGADVNAWAAMSGATTLIGTPVYQDYVVSTPGVGAMDLWIALHPDPDTKPQIYDAILNGMEVFKLQLTNGSLAGLNPIPSVAPAHDGTTKKKSTVGPIVGGVVGGLVVLALGYCCFSVICKRRRNAGKDAGMSDGHSGWLPLSLYGNSHTSSSAKSHTTGSYASSLPSNLCRHFSFAEIKAATNNFDESLILGVGGFGKVYRGEIDGGTTKVLCARPALNPTLPKEEVSLAEWALHCQKKGILDQIVDPYLKGKIAPQCFKKFAETAEKCVSDQGIDRPSMGDVLWNLEFALQMQESAEESGSLGCGMSDEGTPLVMVGKKDPNNPSIESSTTTTTTTSISMGDQSIASMDSDGLTPSAVFSQIMNPKGR
ncbi:unnamed protein product [Miscanthus lutarioriparius]|uniref:Malectin-like domain-containing protein n=1 Tax=Miscanthus lutarioriparius TaxID=422564 RepID=A0A811MR18_9POAL|nr:unnamed protein product [Miscanthus lutarioriparius]